MKYTTAFALLLASSVSGFRDQSQKKPDHLKLKTRALEESCVINHDMADSAGEVLVDVDPLPADGLGLFKVSFQDDQYSKRDITTYAWCVDLDRGIGRSEYSMDLYSAYDPSILTDYSETNEYVVDRPENFDRLAWLINNFNVGDYFRGRGGCRGTITWTELQGAVWQTIDHKDKGSSWHGSKHIPCISEQISEIAMEEGEGYVLDCLDENEQMPLIMIVDDDDNGDIYRQVLMAEVPIFQLDGFCECDPVPPPTERSGTCGHTCDCFTCDAVTEMPNGSLNVEIGHCKDGSISWMCCTGVNGADGTCDVVGGGATCSGAKCETIPKDGGLTINVPAGIDYFTINTHDGQTTGDATVNPVCGGSAPGFTQGGACAKNGATAHCDIDFNLQTDCGYTPTPYSCPVEGEGEDAWAHYSDSTCFNEVAMAPNMDWGWSIPLNVAGSSSIQAAQLTIPVYAAAKDCDTDLGTIVGSVHVAYDLFSKVCSADYSANDGHSIMTFEFYCGSKPYPKRVTNEYVGLPEKYSCVKGEGSIKTPGTNSYCEVPDVDPDADDKIYFIAHATSCSDFISAIPEPNLTPPKEDPPTPRNFVEDPPNKGSGSGDPHFKTWTGDKYDYHGECDLVLLDHPTFNDGLGLRVHIRTTRVKYFSYIDTVAVQIGDDVLEFDNDVEKFLMNGDLVESNAKHHKTKLGGFIVRRDPKALSIRLHDEGRHDRHAAKIDLHTRKNGFPAVIVDGGSTDIFKGSLGLLGDWETGKKMARDGVTEIEVEAHDATPFALEWQVRDTDPMLFEQARFPQYPTTCTPPAKSDGFRIGQSNMQKEAEQACAHWKEDMEDCIFDVMATRDVLIAEEGHIVHTK